MGKKKLSKKQQAFQLFSEGYGPSSPEVKALKLTSGTRLTYHYDWNQLGRPVPSEEKTTKENENPVVKASVGLAGGESIRAIKETTIEPLKLSEEQLSLAPEVPLTSEDKPDEGGGEDGGEEGKGKGEEPKVKGAKPEGVEVPTATDEKKKIPTSILGEGLRVTVFLSISTLTLYQIAATLQSQYDGEDVLTLGDFLDTCAEDFFKVRGKSLGLINTIAGGG